MKIRDCGGAISGKSDNGSAEYQGTPTRLKLGSSYGSVEAEVNDASRLGEADISSENGSVSVSLPANAKVSVEARTASGGLEIEDAPGAAVKSDSGASYSQSWNGGGASVRVRSSYGRVTIRGTR